MCRDTNLDCQVSKICNILRTTAVQHTPLKSLRPTAVQHTRHLKRLFLFSFIPWYSPCINVIGSLVTGRWEYTDSVPTILSAGVHDVFGESVPITGPILLAVGVLMLLLAFRQFYMAHVRKRAHRKAVEVRASNVTSYFFSDVTHCKHDIT